MNRYLLALSLLLCSFQSIAQNAGVSIPQHDDEYSRFVKKLENGDVDIDYTEFRNSFLKSKQYKIRKGAKEYRDLKTAMWSFVDAEEHQKVIETTKKMLSIDYTSMYAHKYLYQAYKCLGDSVNAKKYKEIEFGLLRSVSASGDGKTCETAWQVIQIEEEYFMLYIIKADLIEQKLVNDKTGVCDKMHVKDDGVEKDYYFGISSFLKNLD